MPRLDDLHKEALEAFSEIENVERLNRERWKENVRFARLGEQWPEAMLARRKAEHRPTLMINKIPAMTRTVLNDARQNPVSIKVHPVGNGAGIETAGIFSGLIRNIEYASKATTVYSTALDNSLTGGFGYMRVVTEYAEDDEFEQQIRIKRVTNPLTIYGDPESREMDSSDWNIAFVTELFKEKVFEKRWPNAQKIDWTHNERDAPIGWFDGKDKIRVSEYWLREEKKATLLKLSDGSTMYEPEYMKIRPTLDAAGIEVTGTRPTKTHAVKQYILSGQEVLEENDWLGKYIPIIPVYGDEVCIEGERHFMSLVQWAKDPQRMFNYWRTTCTELIALAPRAPYIGEEGSFTDTRWEASNQTPIAYLEYKVGAPRPTREQFVGPPSGAMQEAMNAADDIKATMGIYDAALGARGNETSGRAILQRQKQSDTATFNYIDNLTSAVMHCGVILIDLIPKVMSGEQVVQIIHEDGTTESVPVNKRFLPEQELSPDSKVYKMGKFAERQKGTLALFDLTVGKYGVTCSSGPSFNTRREEASSSMLELSKQFPPMMQFAGDIFARNLDWPGADEIAERLKTMLPPELKGKSPEVEQLNQQMQQMQGQAKAEIDKLRAIAESKSIEHGKLEVDRYNAVTNRMKMEAGALTPDAVQALVQKTVGEALMPMMQQQVGPQGGPGPVGAPPDSGGGPPPMGPQGPSPGMEPGPSQGPGGPMSQEMQQNMPPEGGQGQPGMPPDGMPPPIGFSGASQ